MRVLVVLTSVLALTAAAPSDRLPWAGLAITDQVTNSEVRLGLDAAARWLVKPQCRALLDEFQDLNGNRLSDNLRATGLDELSYLRELRFHDAVERGPCRRPLTFMFTSPHSRTIFVCGRQAVRMTAADRSHMSVLLIHEALHTLGLGENPPSSQYITARVIAACRR
jgi:hypothetical protein